MNPHGVFVAMDFSLGGMLISRTTSQKMVLMGMAKVVQKDLIFLRELLADGTIKPVIDRTYALHEVPEAIRYLEKEHARGKVVIAM
jgi:NADPH:quinone reductase-like Zn-dependent oxidoreductase